MTASEAVERLEALSHYGMPRSMTQAEADATFEALRALLAEREALRDALRTLDQAITTYQAKKNLNDGSATHATNITHARLALDDALIAARRALGADHAE